MVKGAVVRTLTARFLLEVRREDRKRTNRCHSKCKNRHRLREQIRAEEIEHCHPLSYLRIIGKSARPMSTTAISTGGTIPRPISASFFFEIIIASSYRILYIISYFRVNASSVMCDTNSGSELPTAATALGRSEAGVRPGSVFTSRK